MRDRSARVARSNRAVWRGWSDRAGRHRANPRICFERWHGGERYDADGVKPIKSERYAEQRVFEQQRRDLYSVKIFSNKTKSHKIEREKNDSRKNKCKGERIQRGIF